MSFKDNLLKKIEIERLVRAIAASIGPVDSGRRIDKADLARLMHFFPWTRREERDLVLYLEDDGPEKTRILVLDNDLTIYHTSVEDVVLRKSPTVKEMISIRNAIKILNDKDVVLFQKERSLHVIRDVCVDALDLDYRPADIAAMAAEGRACLEHDDTDGVRECLLLFAELLGMAPAPPAFAVKHCDIYGKIDRTPDGEITIGPLVMFSMVHNSLTWLDGPLGSRDKSRFDRLKAVASGEAEAAAMGPAVFDGMAAKVPPPPQPPGG